MLESPARLVLGLVTGFAFGFLLQKAQVSKFRVIVDQFLLRDFTMVKMMASAIVVGAIGVYALAAFGLATLHIKPALLGGTILGGLIFGVGMAVLGYCPGTGLAAVAEGSHHARFGVLGMLFGAAAFAELYDLLAGSVLTVADYGKATLPEILGVSSPMLIALLAIVCTTTAILIERRGRMQRAVAAASRLSIHST